MRGRLALASLALIVTATGCVANPQQAQTRDLLDQLAEARALLAQPPGPDDACARVGDVETRLYGEPGLTTVQTAWSHLADAAHALQAVCGQRLLLSQQAVDSPAVSAAQERWRRGLQREMSVACDELRAAAQALDRGAPC